MCTSPLRAWKTGRGKLSFRGPTRLVGPFGFANKSGYNQEYELPCGQCIECRIARSVEKAVRIMHEVKIEEELTSRKSTFVTLTYDKYSVPYVYESVDGTDVYRTDRMTLVKDDVQKFLARLREHKRRRKEDKIRYFVAGEYGDKDFRPHYHAVLIGCEFKDEYLFSKSSKGYDMSRSDDLELLWTKGYCTIEEITMDSLIYICKDIVKRVTESDNDAHRKWLRDNNVKSVDEYYNGRQKEFHLQSGKPGLGARWIDKYQSDVFPFCELPKINGVNHPVPRYYIDRIVKKEMELSGKKLEPSKTKVMIGRRSALRKRKRDENYEDRLIDRNEIKKQRRKNYEQTRV